MKGTPSAKTTKIAAKAKAAAPIKPKAAAPSTPQAVEAEAQIPAEPADHSDEHPEIEDEAEDSHDDEVAREREGSATTTATLVDAAPLDHEQETTDVFEKGAVHDEPEEHHDEAIEDHESTAIGHTEATPAEDDDGSEVSAAAHPVSDVASAPRDDLDDIVNMLESKPLISAHLVPEAAPIAKPAVHVDIDEIPDIDEM